MGLYAPAKINWTLEVLGRPDHYRGYHEVRTVLQAIDLCDILEFGPGEGVRLEVEGPHEASEDDLVLRAAALLDGGGGRGARIRLTKRIPVAAGLGGGSSDAAATLRGLNELWRLGLSGERLAEMAAGLGSDVPFFLAGGTALAEGRGERVTPLPDAPQAWLVLLAPPIAPADKTRRMYAALKPSEFSDGSRTAALVAAIREGRSVADGGLYNVFERAAYAAFAGLEAYREALLTAGAQRVHLAGAGPALFSVAEDEAAARAMLSRLRVGGGEGSYGQAFAARTLTAAESLRREG
jgi:4-diphosphocytidyl-2-C-methyl-D-erythritol kinase